MKTSDLVIIKLGGSVLTRKKTNQKKIDRRALKRISEEIASAMKKTSFRLIIIHGVGSFGHIVAKEYSLAEGYKTRGQIAAISGLKRDLEKLDFEISCSLQNEGIKTISFHPSSFLFSDEKGFCAGNFGAIEKSVELGFTPVLYGDIIFSKKKGFEIISGDRIISCLAKYFKPNRIIIGTDVDGVYDHDPNRRKNSKLIKTISADDLDSINISGSTATDVTGGMRGKIAELLSLSKCGLTSQIINIAKPGILAEALIGNEEIGSIIKL